MGWIKNQMMRGVTNRGSQRLAAEFGAGPATGVLALSLAHACYPDAKYGDNGPNDAIIQQIKRGPMVPCNAQEACKAVEQWIDHRSITTNQVFQLIWSKTSDDFLQTLFQSMDD